METFYLPQPYSERLDQLDADGATLADVQAALVENHPWRGKKVACLGTSITFLGEWTTPFEAKLNGTLVNQGIFGGTLSSSASGTGIQSAAIYAQVQSIANDANLVFVEAGINDFRGNATLGTISDTTIATFYGAVNKTIREVLVSYRERSLVFILPYGNTDTAFAGTWNTNNDNGDSLVDFQNAIRECCDRAGIAYIDITKSGIGGRTMPTYSDDGIHLNERGGNRYADFVWESIRNIPYTELETPTTGWLLSNVVAGDVSYLNASGSLSGTTVNHNGATLGSYGVVWLASGAKNAAEFTSSTGWPMFGSGVSGAVGIGDFLSGTATVQGLLANNGTIATSALSPTIPNGGTATKYRLARIGTSIYLDALIGGIWTTIIDGTPMSAFGVSTNYGETPKIGLLVFGGPSSIGGIKTGTFAL